VQLQRTNVFRFCHWFYEANVIQLLSELCYLCFDTYRWNQIIFNRRKYIGM